MPPVEKAPAKLNLGLKITGKRDDGYHDILSIFQTVDLYDELTVKSAIESGRSSTIWGRSSISPEKPFELDFLVGAI